LWTPFDLSELLAYKVSGCVFKRIPDVFLNAVEDFFEDLMKFFEKMQGQDVFLKKKYARDFNFNFHKFIYM
jgi:hypothetical protein